jgi:hypothetical protein
MNAERVDVAIARQRLCKHAPTLTDTHGAIQDLVEAMFLCGPCRSLELHC